MELGQIVAAASSVTVDVGERFDADQKPLAGKLGHLRAADEPVVAGRIVQVGHVDAAGAAKDDQGFPAARFDCQARRIQPRLAGPGGQRVVAGRVVEDDRVAGIGEDCDLPDRPGGVVAACAVDRQAMVGPRRNFDRVLAGGPADGQVHTG